MKINIDNHWREILEEEFKKPYFLKLTQFIDDEYRSGDIFPNKENIFRAFNKCPLESLKVVIIGQDPYHNDGQANGLCFSVDDGVKFPPSLRNIFKEINADTEAPIPQSGNLDRWAEQGVLLINAVLTVRPHEAASHAGKGWEQFTDAVVNIISTHKKGIVFLLWGNYAQNKGQAIVESDNLILQSAHPSPFSASRGFFGCRHFSKTNTYILSQGKDAIHW